MGNNSLNIPWGQYGNVAIRATQLCKKDKIEPPDAWAKAAREEIRGISSRKKGCPKEKFLALCANGKVRGVSQGNYTTSIINKGYALSAVIILRKNPGITKPSLLWKRVLDNLNIESKKHNSQMDVVIALFHNGLLSD